MSTVEETLAWEAQWRPRAATAAFAGGALLLASLLLSSTVYTDLPEESDGFVSLPEALGGAATGRGPGEPSLVVREVDKLGDQAGLLTASTAVNVLGLLLALGALTYLFRATRARFEGIGRAVGWSLAAALALFPIGTALAEIPKWIEYANFADAAERTPRAANEIQQAGVIPAGLLLQTLGIFAFALALVLVSLNAMRVGLLTRFMGILGMIIGGITIVAFGLSPLLLLFWLAFLGLLIAGRYPGGAPPAWQTGRAEPWPTQQQLRERRDAVRAGEPAPVAAAAAAPGGAEGSARGAARRTRKTRR